MNGFEWNSEMDRHRVALERILALLFLMAGLADGATSLSVRRRLNVLAILACGEAEARGFVIGLAGAPIEGDPVIQDFASAGDAERLAVSFRVLALVLGAMLAQARRPALAGGACRRRVLPIAPRAPMPTPPPCRALPAPDTS